MLDWGSQDMISRYLRLFLLQGCELASVCSKFMLTWISLPFVVLERNKERFEWESKKKNWSPPSPSTTNKYSWSPLLTWSSNCWVAAAVSATFSSRRQISPLLRAVCVGGSMKELGLWHTSQKVAEKWSSVLLKEKTSRSSYGTSVHPSAEAIMPQLIIPCSLSVNKWTGQGPCSVSFVLQLAHVLWLFCIQVDR